MPFILYTGLSENVFIRLSASGSYLDIYENLTARLSIDLCYVINIKVSDQLKALPKTDILSPLND